MDNPQNWNRFSYVRNNPILYNDPSGHCIWDGCVIEVLALLAIGVYAGAYLGELQNEALGQPVHQLGEFGDLRHDATFTSYTIAISKGLDENDFWVGSIDIISTNKEVGIFTSTKTLNPIACEEACLTAKGKTSFFVPGISITKTKGVIWGDELGEDVTNYSGGSSVGTLGGGALLGVAVEGFASTNPNTGKRNDKYIGVGVSAGLSLGLDPNIGSYYTWAKPRGIFRKPRVDAE